MNEAGNQFVVQYGAELLQIIVNGLLIPIIVIVGKWLMAKAKNAKVKSIIADVDGVAQKWVIAANQEFVDALKKEGKFDKASQDAVFSQVLQKTLATVTEDTMALLTKYTGDGLEFIKALVLAQVRANKLEV